ncbi:MAG TPA: DUF1772 domain-containing protein [Blastocatellia bacterium]|nr:DUF1772 domain-containing protein [Blastocatellia bacterium]
MQSANDHNAAFFAGSADRAATRSAHALEIWQFINILLSALVTGVFWGTWLGLSRSMATFAPETFLAIGHAMIGNLGTIMAMLMPAAMLATLPVLYLLYRRRSPAFYPTLAGLALFVVALLITLLVEVPLDNQFKEWTVTTLPANWEQLRDRWEWFHVIRSWAAVAGLAMLLVGALFWRDNATRRPSVGPDAPREQLPG